MRRIGAFDEQFEFVSVGILIEFIADFKNPDRTFYEVAVIQGVISYVIELI